MLRERLPSRTPSHPPGDDGAAVDDESAVAGRVERDDLADVPLDLDIAVPDAIALLLEQDHARIGNLDGEGDLLVRLHLREGETADLGRSVLENEGEGTLGQAAQREGPVAGDGRRDGRSLQYGDGHGRGARRAGAGRTERARSLHGAADHDALGIRSGGISTAGDERDGGEDEDSDEGKSSLTHGTSLIDPSKLRPRREGD
jgi:hypothetical protein